MEENTMKILYETTLKHAIDIDGLKKSVNARARDINKIIEAHNRLCNRTTTMLTLASISIIICMANNKRVKELEKKVSDLEETKG